MFYRSDLRLLSKFFKFSSRANQFYGVSLLGSLAFYKAMLMLLKLLSVCSSDIILCEANSIISPNFW